MEIIESLDALRAWVQTEPEQRHQKVDDLTCSCGWSAVPSWDIDWDSHYQAAPIGDLRDVLGSSHSGFDDNAPNEPNSCEQIITFLWSTIDAQNAAEDEMVDIMVGVALGTRPTTDAGNWIMANHPGAAETLAAFGFKVSR